MVGKRRAVRDGMVVGFIAYLTVALFYFLFDLLAAREAFHTVDRLGRAVFRGLRDPALMILPSPPDMAAIFLYNGLHLLLALAIGLVVVQLVERAEREPAQARLMLGAIVAGFVVTVFVVGWLTTPMRPVLPWWSIAVANLLASALAAGYLLRQRPGLWGRLTVAPA